jgi:nitrite reductase (NADH) small subunit
MEVGMNKGLIVNIGPLDQIPIGQGRCFVIKGEDIGVFRSREGEIFAIDNKCPHAQGPLSDGITGNGKVICPLHGHKFDLKTGRGDEESECVRAFDAWEENGDILIELLPKAQTATA